MALLASIASAATPRVAVAPSVSRPWRRSNLSSCAPWMIQTEKSFAGICRVQAVDNVEITPEEFALGPPVEIATPAERPLWLPGSTPPAYLDGTALPPSDIALAAAIFRTIHFENISSRLAGDFGFDPLGLGQEPQDLRWYVQAELVHARFAMAGVAGILFTDLLRATGRTDVPLWYEAGAYKFDFADTKTLFVVQLLLMGFVETKRWMDFVEPGSQATEDSFFGFEAAFKGLDNGYPGGPLFNPLGFSSDRRKSHPMRLKEIKNGRLAMVAMVGFIVQAYVTKSGPIENLMTHLSDPVHTTIIQRIANH